MAEIRKITCDLCGTDLTTTDNMVGWRIVLKSEQIPPAGGALTAMSLGPDFKSAKHFCNARCFSKWCEAWLSACKISD